MAAKVMNNILLTSGEKVLHLPLNANSIMVAFLS